VSVSTDTFEFRMPSLGADMEEGRITEWLVRPGDDVTRGQIVAVVETEKSDIEIEIFHAGVIDELLVAEGTRVPVGTPIAVVRAAGAEPSHVPSVRSPLVRHLAEELHVDLAAVHGSGPGGLVTRDDVAAAGTSVARPRVTPRARRLAAELGVPLDGADGRLVTGADVLAGSPASTPEPRSAPPADSMRRAIAALMARSWAEIPHFHVGSRIDVTGALGALTRSVTERVIPGAMLLHAIARAAAQVPALNGWWVDGGLRHADRVDLGVILSLRSGGLVVPTIEGADRLTLDELMARLRELTSRARHGRMRGSDVVPASITVTSLGDLGCDTLFGVIHPPQVALVGLGSIHEEPWAQGGLLGVRSVVYATLAGDHRAVDGLVGATFLSVLATLLASAPILLEHP
jgi:pyruvate dehydrogenase E2 component (dihydrolipoamide acetyltransferase)